MPDIHARCPSGGTFETCRHTNHAAQLNSGYADQLADQLVIRHSGLLATAEDDIALLRGRLAIVTQFIHNPDYDDTARRTLAHNLGLSEPAPLNGAAP